MIRALLDPSAAALLCKRLTDKLGRDGAKRALATILSDLTNVELAALGEDWSFWARPKQLPPANWVSWGNLTARGWGKSMTIAHVINAEVEAGRAPVVTMAAQNMTKSEAVQVEGLIAAAPPWFRPEYEASRQQLHWPNGAVGYVFSPEAPDAIRSPNANLAWLSEIQSWPKATREEAYSNFVFSTRVGGARLLWDATPKRRHPILKRLLARAEAQPDKHFVVRGTIYENPYIAKAALETMEFDYGGTQKGREELLGEMLDDDEDAIFKAAWFDKSRRGVPEKLVRRIISVDPAITTDTRYSDETGIVDMGIGVDGQVYVFENLSGVRQHEEWSAAVVDAYVRGHCDLIFLETNRGGDSWEAILRIAVRDRGMTLEKLGPETPPGKSPHVVYFRPINTKRSKVLRAEGAAALCERGRVTLLPGKLGDFEEKLFGFDGSDGNSDDVVDAFVHGCHELVGLGSDAPDPRAAFGGIAEMAKAIEHAKPNTLIDPRNSSRMMATLLGGIGGGGRI